MKDDWKRRHAVILDTVGGRILRMEFEPQEESDVIDWATDAGLSVTVKHLETSLTYVRTREAK